MAKTLIIALLLLVAPAAGLVLKAKPVNALLQFEATQPVTACAEVKCAPILASG